MSKEPTKTEKLSLPLCLKSWLSDVILFIDLLQRTLWSVSFLEKLIMKLKVFCLD